MEMVKNSVGLSREYIIHPGETLSEVLEDREMTQRELAVRTGMTEKHISTVIRGQKGISAAFAKKLEYALGIETAFWMNLQAIYDREILEFEELNNITDKEISVLSHLKEVIKNWISLGWLDSETNQASLVLDLRKSLGISNLVDIPKITFSGAFRAQRKNKNIDPYILFAWQRMCELLAQNSDVTEEVDTDKLREKISDIKKVMFMKPNQIQKELTDIFSECGIIFRIVPNFIGAPVQGFIKKSENEKPLILCMTLRQKFIDIFWFTLFHEIAHILNGDTKQEFIDFDSVSGEIEQRADKMAGEFLINTNDYKTFVNSKEYNHSLGIKNFAKSQNVKEYIILGRLMNDKIIPWKSRPRYDWT